MPFQLRSTTKPIFLFIPILLISSLVVLSQVSVVEGGSTEQKTEKLKIGVPSAASFKNFVQISSSSENPNEKNYTGFCIRVFKEVWKRLGYPATNYEFVEFNGAYDDLVANVANKPPSQTSNTNIFIRVPMQVFQKGCALAADVSKVILQLSEDGTLKKLEEDLLTPNKECLKSETTTENIDSLSLRSFWGLFLFSATTSSVCFLLFLGHLLKDYLGHQSSQVADVNTSNESVSIKTVRVARYLMNAEIGSPWRSPSSDQAVHETDMC
ncbi:hypothetical protein RHSIM_Rhsim13G0184600 [Rhododendron simsii]|uniref:Ionotropic glutamate receptor n=1 Tax=Rhododendron simsii TaxID=118357 RepID=A0A834G679_RHOSS|nr:hypothetical protein RHSIM_Rhsim13G0184600 [Rhododendron simsii]